MIAQYGTVKWQYHVAEKPRRGASKVDTNITMITSGASCRDAATAYFVTD